MSQTVISTLVGLLAFVLPKLGLTVGTPELTTTLTTLVTIGSFLWIYVRRVQAGDVTKLGLRK